MIIRRATQLASTIVSPFFIEKYIASNSLGGGCGGHVSPAIIDCRKRMRGVMQPLRNLMFAAIPLK
ncbi:hypothetical protein [Duganella sp. P38]|jgi:hypothetical protein|uniref:hypothetical protein n=1 Tax=Duganella sp. P38 TaxID=3423949 RepID=UPI003D78EA41